MTDLSDLTTDELLAKVSGQYLALHGVAMDLHDELRRRLSAGEQAEARVVELERERNEALARVDGGLWEDWLRASELRDVAERERDRLRAALDVIAGFEDVGPRQANEMREIARRVLSAGSEGSEKDVPPEFARCLVYTAGVRCEGYANPSGRCDAHEGGNQ